MNYQCESWRRSQIRHFKSRASSCMTLTPFRGPATTALRFHFSTKRCQRYLAGLVSFLFFFYFYSCMIGVWFYCDDTHDIDHRDTVFRCSAD